MNDDNIKIKIYSNDGNTVNAGIEGLDIPDGGSSREAEVADSLKDNTGVGNLIYANSSDIEITIINQKVLGNILFLNFTMKLNTESTLGPTEGATLSNKFGIAVSNAPSFKIAPVNSNAGSDIVCALYYNAEDGSSTIKLNRENPDASSTKYSWLGNIYTFNLVLPLSAA